MILMGGTLNWKIQVSNAPLKQRLDNSLKNAKIKPSSLIKMTDNSNQLKEFGGLTEPTYRLLEAFKPRPEEELGSPDIPKIEVNHLVSRMAFVYEKIRNIIEYQEEHLLRKNAIDRILKRRLGPKVTGESMAKPLISELIRARYLKNSTVPESMVGEVAKIINRYFELLNKAPTFKSSRQRRKLLNWILNILSTEIEAKLSSHHQDEALVNFMYQVIHPHIVFPEKMEDEREKNLQIYIAIHRALIKSDNPILRYYLFKIQNPSWPNCGAEEKQRIADHLYEIRETIEKQLEHPLAERLFRLMKKYTVLFQIVKDVIAANPDEAEKVLKTPGRLEEEIKRACDRKYAAANAKLKRSAIRAIIYIFITKMFLAFVLEFPYDLYVAKKLDWIPLSINVIFHPILMFIIALSIRVPADANTQMIIKGIREIIYPNEERQILSKARQPLTRSRFLNFTFTFIYSITFIISFGLIIYLLRLLNFNPASTAIFIIFLSLISFFGIKTRLAVKELVIVTKRQGIFGLLIDFFTLPIVRLGRWITLKSPKINLLIFVLDFIIEAPLKAIIELIEDWVNFLKEKKEELY